MSDFKQGVYQLHAIDDQGVNTYFDQSGFLRSEEQLRVWFESTSAQSELPENCNWYPLNDSDARFKTVAVMKQEVKETPNTFEPKQDIPKNVYEISNATTNQVVLAHEKNQWAKRNEKKLKARQSLMNYIENYWNE
jgi:hypothetical protein|tara:strand:- start:986 stop:1393 length:408 start_codon:yes stop_codon:yes gene_type:complete